MDDTPEDVIAQAGRRRAYINRLNEGMAGLNQYGRMNNACVIGEMASFIVEDYDNLLAKVANLEGELKERLDHHNRNADSLWIPVGECQLVTGYEYIVLLADTEITFATWHGAEFGWRQGDWAFDYSEVTHVQPLPPHPSWCKKTSPPMAGDLIIETGD